LMDQWGEDRPGDGVGCYPYGGTSGNTVQEAAERTEFPDFSRVSRDNLHSRQHWSNCSGALRFAKPHFVHVGLNASDERRNEFT